MCWQFCWMASFTPPSHLCSRGKCCEVFCLLEKIVWIKIANKLLNHHEWIRELEYDGAGIDRAFSRLEHESSAILQKLQNHVLWESSTISVDGNYKKLEKDCGCSLKNKNITRLLEWESTGVGHHLRNSWEYWALVWLDVFLGVLGSSWPTLDTAWSESHRCHGTCGVGTTVGIVVLSPSDYPQVSYGLGLLFWKLKWAHWS